MTRICPAWCLDHYPSDPDTHHHTRELATSHERVRVWLTQATDGRGRPHAPALAYVEIAGRGVDLYPGELAHVGWSLLQASEQLDRLD